MMNFITNQRMNAMANKSILALVADILSNTKSVYSDVTRVLEVYKDAKADGVITDEEIQAIMAAVAKVLSDITIAALDIKDAISK